MLVERGLKYAFGVTGSGFSMALITELESRGVRYFPASHEASAALMAGAVTRLTDDVSVSISIKGPGLANMLPGLAHNHFENNPALSISEAFGSGDPSHRMHKRLDHGSLVSTVTKEFITLDDLDTSLPASLSLARTEAPGPVHLDLCSTENVQANVPISDVEHVTPASRSASEKALEELKKCERPVLLVGSLMSRRSSGPSLASLNIPTFTTAAAKGVLDENLVHSAGVFTGDGKDLATESHIFKEADLVIGIGLRNAEVLSPKPFSRFTILLDEVDEGHTAGFDPDLLVTDGDDQLMRTVLNLLGEKCWGLEELQSLKCQMQCALIDSTWLPGVCFQYLNELTGPNTLVLDTGYFNTIGEHIWRAGPDRIFVASSNSRFMGTAIPSAIGAAFCGSKSPIFCVTGDGGMRMYPAEINLAVQEQLSICFILMTDGRFGSVASALRPESISQSAVMVPHSSWWKTIESLGCESHVVESEQSFLNAIQGWDACSPMFVEAAFEPNAYSRMTAELR